MIRPLVHSLLRRFDMRLDRLSRHPTHTMLGLASLPIRTVIDVGANEGQFARQALSVFPAARVISFEPLPPSAERLREFAKGTQGRLTVHQVALGSSKAELPMYHHSQHSPSSSLLQTTNDCENYFPQTRAQSLIEVQVRRLDDVISESGEPLEHPVLIKVDVQGYEAEVLAGSEQTLMKSQACIIEINLEQLYVGAPDFESIARQLNKVGLQYRGALEQFCAPDGHVIFMDAVFARAGTWQRATQPSQR